MFNLVRQQGLGQVSGQDCSESELSGARISVAFIAYYLVPAGGIKLTSLGGVC